MKIAFDENIPSMMVIVFQALAKDGGVLKTQIVTAADYRPKGEKGDEHWVVRFAKDGGQIIISGDTKMHGRLHELAALVESGVVTYFFERKWSTFSFFTKSAMLLHWWPKVREHMDTAGKGTCWEIPCQWLWKDLVDVSVDPQAISKASSKKSG